MRRTFFVVAALVALLLAAVVSLADQKVMIYDGSSSYCRLGPWGNGIAKPADRGVTFLSKGAAQVTTRGYYEGARFDLVKTFELGPFLESPSNSYLVLIVQAEAPRTGRGGGGPDGMGPGGMGPGGMGPGGMGPGGMGPGGMGPGGMGPGGMGPGGMGPGGMGPGGMGPGGMGPGGMGPGGMGPGGMGPGGMGPGGMGPGGMGPGGMGPGGMGPGGMGPGGMGPGGMGPGGMGPGGMGPGGMGPGGMGPGGMGPGGMGPGGMGPGGGSGRMGSVVTPPVSKVRAVIVTDKGLIDCGAADIDPDAIEAEGWSRIVIPADRFRGTGKAADARVLRIALFGDVTGTFYVGRAWMAQEDVSLVADPGPTRRRVRVGEDVSFEAAEQPAGVKSRYVWDFDDVDGIAEDAIGPTSSWRFDEEGLYVVTLSVTDPAGAKTAKVAHVFVLAEK